MNSADPALFHRGANLLEHDPNTFVFIYHGSFFERYGLDVAIVALGRPFGRAAPAPALYGDGEHLPACAASLKKLGLEQHVLFGGWV